jgi:hypothetical protein
MKRFLIGALLLAFAPMAFAGDTVDHTDARDRLELGHQIKQSKQEMRRERRAARSRFYASKYEERAKALRTEDRALEKANKDTPTEK